MLIPVLLGIAAAASVHGIPQTTTFQHSASNTPPSMMRSSVASSLVLESNPSTSAGSATIIEVDSTTTPVAKAVSPTKHIRLSTFDIERSSIESRVTPSGDAIHSLYTQTSTLSQVPIVHYSFSSSGSTIRSVTTGRGDQGLPNRSTSPTLSATATPATFLNVSDGTVAKPHSTGSNSEQGVSSTPGFGLSTRGSPTTSSGRPKISEKPTQSLPIAPLTSETALQTQAPENPLSTRKETTFPGHQPATSTLARPRGSDRSGTNEGPEKPGISTSSASWRSGISEIPRNTTNRAIDPTLGKSSSSTSEPQEVTTTDSSVSPSTSSAIRPGFPGTRSISGTAAVTDTHQIISTGLTTSAKTSELGQSYIHRTSTLDRGPSVVMPTASTSWRRQTASVHSTVAVSQVTKMPSNGQTTPDLTTQPTLGAASSIYSGETVFNTRISQPDESRIMSSAKPPSSGTGRVSDAFLPPSLVYSENRNMSASPKPSKTYPTAVYMEYPSTQEASSAGQVASGLTETLTAPRASSAQHPTKDTGSFAVTPTTMSLSQTDASDGSDRMGLKDASTSALNVLSLPWPKSGLNVLSKTDDTYTLTTLVLDKASSPRTDRKNGPESSVTRAPLPSALPNAIRPSGSSQDPPDGAIAVYIGFSSRLNYVFVSDNLDAASSIIVLLPRALADAGDMSAADIPVNALVPYDTRQQWGYITTLAKIYYPATLVDKLQVDVSTPTSKLYNNLDSVVRNLTVFINPRIDVRGNIKIGGPTTTTGPTLTSSTGSNTDAFAANNTGEQSSKQRATTIGIATGAVGGSMMCGAILVWLSSRYKRRKLAFQRLNPVARAPDGDCSSSMYCNGLWHVESGAYNLRHGLQSGEKLGKTPSGTTKTSERSTHSMPKISAPIRAENSLGWY